jgi:hypothetical protein
MSELVIIIQKLRNSDHNTNIAENSDHSVQMAENNCPLTIFSSAATLKSLWNRSEADWNCTDSAASDDDAGLSAKRNRLIDQILF